MNNRILIAIIFAIFSLTLFTAFSQYNKAGIKSGNEGDCVPDKEKAIEIAESVWLKAYGKSIYNRKPFIATLNDSGIWIVKGTLHTRKGGVPYIEIQKKDCKILKVKHGK